MVLTDGEHYPSVTRDAIAELQSTRDYQVLAAVFIGGTEKISSDSDFASLGVPVVRGGNYLQSIREAIKKYNPDEVLDLSDEPIIGYRERFEIASHVLANGAAYRGADFLFSPPRFTARVTRPSISIIGTGKRIGKTAVGGFVARTLAEKHNPLVVTMGRGGPAEPEFLNSAETKITPEYLLSVSKQGRHASSDYFEDLLTARVTTIGCRRCGGGMSGQTFVSNVPRGAQLSEQIEADLVIFEGSGSSIPPVETEGRILVIGANQPLDYMRLYLGPYRILISDLIILTMCEPPLADQAKIDAMGAAIKEINPNCTLVNTVFRPKPLGDIKGKRVLLTLTAPAVMLKTISAYLESTYQCRVVGASPHLSNRPLLKEDLERFGRLQPEVVLSELKAAAVDVVTAWGLEKGLEVVYLDNEPIPTDPNVDLKAEVLRFSEKLNLPSN
ncbi:MAG: 2,3-diphosphoglycerate synthetase [Firmicutes bacterium]|nr:2,3-diphosphoglycerate synthetase [Bacillota bacterium]